MNRIIAWFKRISGVSTPIGGVSWNPPKSQEFDAPTFKGHVLITSDGNDQFIAFLEENTSRVVFLDTTLDASVATSDQIQYIEDENLEMDPMSKGEFTGKTIPLKNDLDKLVYINFGLYENRRLVPSFGGTGTMTFPLKGYFEITSSLHGGPSTHYHIKELHASLEARLARNL